MIKRESDFFRGCLVGGAIGDALGAPVEFLTRDEIISQYGPGGIGDLAVLESGKALITDDTQLTLFTAEGILRAKNRMLTKGLCQPTSVVYHAYQRWLLTQGYPRLPEYEWIYDGWLLGIKELHAQRAPGVSCLTALRSDELGTIEAPINTSKGCGGIMRAAPAGLYYRRDDAFRMAAEFAALTHGHPSGYLSAGALAYLIDALIEGVDLETAVTKTMMMLKGYTGHEECLKKLQLAEQLSKMGTYDDEAIALLGQGWVGEEALAISVYCALKYQDDFRKAVQVAVNHDGDSDSTGAITGNILGLYRGLSEIPEDWIEKVELKEVLIQVADDLLTDDDEQNVDLERYPGY
jgi:ADP-ribosylglycohydrolase